VTAEAKGIVRIVPTGIDKTAATIKKSFADIGKDAARHMKTAFLAGTAGIAAGITAALGKTIRDGMKQAFVMENSQVLMTSMLGSMEKAKEAMAMISQEAKENPFFSKQALAESAQALAGFANGSVANLKGMVELSEKLYTLKPEAGLNGAAQALRDAIGGETERLKEYGFKSSTLSQMKKSAGPGADLRPFIEQAVRQMGITESTLRAMGQTKESQFMAIENTMANIGEQFTNDFWPQLKPQLDGLLKYLQENTDKIITSMQGVATAIVEGFKAAMAIGDAASFAGKWWGDKFWGDWYSPKNSAQNMEGPIHGAGAFWGNLLTGQGWDKSVAAGMAAQSAQQGAMLGKRAIEIQNNIRMTAPTGSLMPGMQHT